MSRGSQSHCQPKLCLSLASKLVLSGRRTCVTWLATTLCWSASLAGQNTCLPRPNRYPGHWPMGFPDSWGPGNPNCSAHCAGPGNGSSRHSVMDLCGTPCPGQIQAQAHLLVKRRNPCRNPTHSTQHRTTSQFCHTDRKHPHAVSCLPKPAYTTPDCRMTAPSPKYTLSCFLWDGHARVTLDVDDLWQILFSSSLLAVSTLRKRSHRSG